MTSLSTLRHSAILPLLGCTPFNNTNELSIVTPLMKSSLQEWMNKEQEGKGKAPAEWNATRKHIILIGLAAGMLMMHENNMIH
jgi:hypothetical protein